MATRPFRDLSYGHLALALGAALFLFAKLFMVWAQTSAMGMPRLGDDAFVHLWRAEQVGIVGPLDTLGGKLNFDARGMRDIRDFCAEPNVVDPESAQICARAADNTVVPDVKAGSSLLLHLATKLGLSLKWSYALYESLIVVLIAGGFALFLVRLYGPASAGVALALMAFLVLFPPQGLEQFIPSTLVIGLSTALLGIVATTSSPRTYLLCILAAAALGIFHPVALVFGVGIVMLGFLSLVRGRHAKLAWGGLIFSALAAAVLVLASETLRSAIVEAVSTNFVQNLSDNAAALPRRMAIFAEKNWGFAAAFVAALAASLALRRRPSWPVLACGGVLILLLAGSLLHKTIFFTFDIPLDLFARLFVVFSVLACGFIAKTIIDLLWQRPLWGKPCALVLIAAAILPSAFVSYDTLFFNMNLRSQVVNERALRQAIDRLPADTTIAYAELDLSLDAAFLAGAYRLGAIPLGGLPEGRLLTVLEERRPQAMILPDFQPLNYLASIRSPSFETRRHGFPSREIDTVAVSLPTGALRSVYLLVENVGTEGVVITPAVVTEARRRVQLPALFIGPGEKKWVQASAADLGTIRAMFFNLNGPGLWVLGASVDEPARPGVNWPWDSRAQFLWHARGTPANKISGLTFDPLRLLEEWRAPLPYDDGPLTQDLRVLSDDSGLVLLQTRYATAP